MSTAMFDITEQNGLSLFTKSVFTLLCVALRDKVAPFLVGMFIQGLIAAKAFSNLRGGDRNSARS